MHRVRVTLQVVMLGFWCRLQVPADRRRASWYEDLGLAALWSGHGRYTTPTTTLIMVSYTGWLPSGHSGRGRVFLMIGSGPSAGLQRQARLNVCCQWTENVLPSPCCLYCVHLFKDKVYTWDGTGIGPKGSIL